MPPGGGTSTTVTKQELSPEQQRLLKGVIPIAENYLKTPLQLFPGSTVAGFTPLQDEGMRNTVDAARNTVQPMVQGAIGGNTQAGQTGAAGAQGGTAQLIGAGGYAVPSIGRILQEYNNTQGSRDFLSSGALLDPATNPVLGAQTRAALGPITERLTEQVLPGIRGTAVSNNMFGSSRQGIAEGMAMRDYMRQAGDIATNLQAENFRSGLGAMLSTVGQAGQLFGQIPGVATNAASAGGNLGANLWQGALDRVPQLSNLAFLPGTALDAVGTRLQGMDQAKLSEQAQRFTTQQMLPFMQAQDVANLAFGIGGGSSTATSSQNPPFDPAGTALGVGLAAKFLPMMFGLPPIFP